jgi:hypothetical protein
VLVPTFNWRHRRDLHSGKHKRYGANVQVAADIHGRVDGVAGPFPGSWHDKRCYDEAGLSGVEAASGSGAGDSGYQGTEPIPWPSHVPVRQRGSRNGRTPSPQRSTLRPQTQLRKIQEKTEFPNHFTGPKESSEGPADSHPLLGPSRGEMPPLPTVCQALNDRRPLSICPLG